MVVEDAFLGATPVGVTSFLVDFYQGTPEGGLIRAVQAAGRTVFELPSDFEPLDVFRKSDLAGLAEKLSAYDFVVLYPGTSTRHAQGISEHGLLPRAMTKTVSQLGDVLSLPDSVYFGHPTYSGLTSVGGSVKVFAHTAACVHGGLPLIIRAVLPVGELLPDEDARTSRSGPESVVRFGTARVLGPVGPERLFLHPQGVQTLDEPYMTDLQEFTFYDFAVAQGVIAARSSHHTLL